MIDGKGIQIMVQFLCIGAQKAGTTTLHNIIKQHRNIFLPSVKELRYFSKDRFYAKGVEWYHKYFNKIKDESAIGEITPNYLCSTKAAERIYKYNKDMKIIIILRDPVERAYSHYLMKKRNGKEKLDFDTCIDNELKQLEKSMTGNELEINESNAYGYIARGLYFKQIERYLKYFDIDKIHILTLEEFVKNPEMETNKIFGFLGVEENQCIDYTIKSNSHYMPRFKMLHNILIRIPDRFRSKFFDHIPGILKKIYKRFTRKEQIKAALNPVTVSKIYDFLKKDMERLSTLSINLAPKARNQ
jgi:hypothetical protein